MTTAPVLGVPSAHIFVTAFENFAGTPWPCGWVGECNGDVTTIEIPGPFPEFVTMPNSKEILYWEFVLTGEVVQLKTS